MKKLGLIVAFWLALVSQPFAQQGVVGFGSFVLLPNSPIIDLNFVSNQYLGGGPSGLTNTRSTTATDLIYTDPAGYSYNTYAAGVSVIRPGKGLLVFEARTNFLLNSAAPATQTTGTLANGTYVLWVNGSGSATMSSGTATGCGTGVSTQGNPLTFTLTGTTGTCVVTVAGSLNAFQLELSSAGSTPTSFIVTTGTTATRNADVISLTAPPAFGSAYSIYGQGLPFAPITYTLAQTLISIDDGTTANRAYLVRVATTAISSAGLFSGGVQGMNSVGLAWGQNTLSKFAAAFTAGAQNSAFAGNLLGAASGASLPVSPTTFHIGCRAVGDQIWNGIITRIAYYSSALNTTQLASVTAP